MLITTLAATGVALAVSGPVTALAADVTPAGSTAPSTEATTTEDPATTLSADAAPAEADANPVPVAGAPAARAHVELKGDLLVNGNSTSTAPAEVVEAPEGKDTVAKVTANLDVEEVTKQMKKLEQDYGIPSEQLSNITLSHEGEPGVTSTFTATYRITDGLEFDKSAPTLSENDLFEITNDVIAPDGLERTVTMTLKNPGYATYKELFEAVSKVKTLSMDFNVIVKKGTTELQTIRGDVNGSFESTASYLGHVIPFELTWSGVQSDGGADSIAPDSINATIKVTPAPASEETPAPEAQAPKPAASKHMAPAKALPQTSDSSAGVAGLAAMVSAGVAALVGAARLRRQS